MQEVSETNTNKRLETSSNHIGGAVKKKPIPLVFDKVPLDKHGLSLADYR